MRDDVAELFLIGRCKERINNGNDNRQRIRILPGLGSLHHTLIQVLGARTHAGHSRAEWIGELEASWVYLVHRSFSWFIVAAAVQFFRMSGRLLAVRGRLEALILGLVLAQMLLGVVLAHVGVVAVAQVLHIGLSSLLVSGLFLWLLGASARGRS